MRFRPCLVLNWMIGSAALALANGATAQTVSDPSLKVQTWVTGFDNPTGAAFLNDAGDALVIEKNTGLVKLVQNRQIKGAVLDLPVSNDSERGLLGITLSPNFAADQFVYLYYTASQSDGGAPISNSIKRYRFTGNGLTFNKKIADLPATPGPNHDGGKMRFGLDGKLYVISGELNRNEQTSNHKDSTEVNRIGAILRLNSSGSAAPTNPFYNSAKPKAPLSSIFAYGIRNSFGIAFDPVSSTLWESENGPAFYDEINRITPGFNGGWESIMGPVSRHGGDTGPLVSLSDRSHYEDPEFSWATPVAPTAMQFFPTGRLGSQYRNDLFVGDVRGGKIFHFDLSPSRKTLSLAGALADGVADNSTSERFAEQDALLWGDNFGIVTELLPGPGGMYVLSLDGSLFRITTRTANVPASARASVVPEPSGLAPALFAILAFVATNPRRALRTRM